jgi:hypothetical protein
MELKDREIPWGVKFFVFYLENKTRRVYPIQHEFKDKFMSSFPEYHYENNLMAEEELNKFLENNK